MQSSDCRLQECNDSSATSCKNPDAHDPWLYPECSIGCVSSPSRVSLSLTERDHIYVYGYIPTVLATGDTCRHSIVYYFFCNYYNSSACLL